MKKHCISLGLAKQLKEAGWKKETEFWWCDAATTSIFTTPTHLHLMNCIANHYPAPLATEILEELPIVCSIFCDGIYTIDAENYKTVDLSLPNALAKMWLYLKKENLL
jgi:hypothetical protein